MKEIEMDGFITPERELAKPMERTAVNTAIPATECVYPRCEECDEYVRYKGDYYCDVPMVISKQMYHEALNKERVLEDRLCFIEELVLEATFNRDARSQERGEEHNIDDGQMTWSDTDATVIQLAED